MPALPVLPRALALLALSAACQLALGADHAAAPAPQAAAAEPAKAPSATEPATRKPKAVPIEVTRDPLDMIRERLARKLGAIKAPDTPNPNVMRVLSKTSAPTSTDPTPAAEAKRPVQRRPAAATPVHGAGSAHAAHWDYGGAGGPDTWGRMKPEFSKCATGTRQSPIDIRDGIKVELDPVQFDYMPSGFRVVDNGHTVQVNLAAGNSIEVLGRRYELVQFHFHRPSEERINGKQFEMVVHLVHKDLEGRLAVVAVLLDRGAAQGVVQSVWNNLPLEKGEEVPARTLLNVNELLPPERHYFTYMGSLTTPPCSEGVLWMVMKQPVPVSAEQIGIFARLYPMNARPIQSASGRLIKESN
ncbi:MAG: carbonic anhydrase family protein [Pseudomonadota bacterium]